MALEFVVTKDVTNTGTKLLGSYKLIDIADDFEVGTELEQIRKSKGLVLHSYTHPEHASLPVCSDRDYFRQVAALHTNDRRIPFSLQEFISPVRGWGIGKV